jgi:uncharacterized membrane protein
MPVRRPVLAYLSAALLALLAFAIAAWASGEPLRSVGFGFFGIVAILIFIWTTFSSARRLRGWKLILLLAIALFTAVVVLFLLALGDAAVECQSHNNCLFN